ncbi:DUF1559 domain-containing protein [Mariniblastus sp.]|nr:DUF1559 domain-containing protein [Mariniblastus sp.]
MDNSENPQPSSTGRNASWWIVFTIPIAFLVIAMLLLWLRTGTTLGLANCQSNVSNVGIAISNYETFNGFLPRAVFLSENNIPRSWRVEILPQLDQQALRDQYQDDQPWDSSANLRVGKAQRWPFRCPSDPNTVDESGISKTSYALITGPETAFPNDKRLTFRDIVDGASNTIILLEINDGDIGWTEPRDLTIDEAIALFNRPYAIRKKHPTNHRHGRVVAFADGHIDIAPENTPPEVLRALFTIDDGQEVSLDTKY